MLLRHARTTLIGNKRFSTAWPKEGSRIANAIWQPARDILPENGPFTQPSGYIIILGYPH
jgi:hypothetical protein